MPPKKIGVNSKAQAGRVRNSERKEKELDKANRVSIPIPKVTDAELPRRGDEEQVHIQANLLPVTGNDQSLQIQANETPSDFVHVIEARSDEDASAQMSEAHNLPVARHPDIRLKASFKRPHCSCRGKTSLMRPFPQLLDHEEVIFSWALQRRRTRPQPQLLSKCRKLTLQWGHTHHRTSSRLHAQPRRSSTKNLKNPPRHVFDQGLTSGAPKQTQRQANMNPMVTQSTRQPTYTVFGYEDYHLQCMKEHYRKKNIGIVIREESELKIMRKENQRKLRAKEKGKENQKGKEKENQSPNLPVGFNKNLPYETTIRQRKRQERDNGDVRPIQIAQRLRREREKQAKIIQSQSSPFQPRFFPGLLPMPSKRAAYERECIAIKNHFYHHPSLLHAPSNSNRIPPVSILPAQALHSTNSDSTREEILIPPDNMEHIHDSRNIILSSMPTSPTSTLPITQSIIDKACVQKEALPTNIVPRSHLMVGRHYLDKMNIQCPHCLALHWKVEKLSNSCVNRPFFGTCCLQGKIRLPQLLTPPPEIQSLYDGDDDQSKSFRSYTRLYNAANAFTSLGVHMDDRVVLGRGPKAFTIHGELRHRTGLLQPPAGQDPVYAQLYIHDADVALEYRSRRNPKLREDVLRTIQDSLLRYNSFSEKFRHAAAILSREHLSNHDIPAYLHYSAAKDRRTHNLPTSDEVAVILPGDGAEFSAMRDIIVRLRGSDQLMQINECHPAYLPLHYVLLFPYGELGWEPNFRQWDVNQGKASSKRLTQLQYYGYRLFERPTEYSTILRGGRLFQEFIVDAWAATEQNRLTYYRLNQQKLRSDLYQDLVVLI